MARALAAVPLRAVYSSPLCRALDTASAIAVEHRLAVVAVDALKEIALGAWEGLTTDEVAARYPDLLAARRRDPLHVAPPGGETIREVRDRAVPAVEAIIAAHAGETVAIVAHGAVNKTVLLSVLGLPLETYGRMPQDNAGFNVLEWEAGAARVAVVNETSHLAGLPTPREGWARSRADKCEKPAAPPAYTPLPEPE